MRSTCEWWNTGENQGQYHASSRAEEDIRFVRALCLGILLRHNAFYKVKFGVTNIKALLYVIRILIVITLVL